MFLKPPVCSTWFNLPHFMEIPVFFGNYVPKTNEPFPQPCATNLTAKSCVPKLLGSQHSNIGSKFMPIWCGKSPPCRRIHPRWFVRSHICRQIIEQISQKLAPWANKNGFVWRQIFWPTPFFSSTSPSYRCSKLHPTTLGGSAPNQVDALVKLPIWGKPWRSWDGGKIHKPIV